MPTPQENSPTDILRLIPGASERLQQLARDMDLTDPLTIQLLTNFRDLEEMTDFMRMPSSVKEALQFADDTYQKANNLHDMIQQQEAQMLQGLVVPAELLRGQMSLDPSPFHRKQFERLIAYQSKKYSQATLAVALEGLANRQPTKPTNLWEEVEYKPKVRGRRVKAKRVEWIGDMLVPIPKSRTQLRKYRRFQRLQANKAK